MSAKNKSQRSLVLIILLSVWGVYVGISGLQYWHEIKKIAQGEVERRRQTVDYFLKSATSFLVSEKVDPLKASMQEAQSLHLVDFYILQKGAEVLDFKNNSGRVEDLNHNYQNFNVFVSDSNLFFKTIKIFDYKLTAGAYANTTKMTLNHVWMNLDIFLRDIALVTLFMWGAILYILKDIFKLSAVLQGQNKKNALDELQSHSQEGEALLRAAQSYEKSNEFLSRDREIYAQTVGPALLAELNSGRPAPYSFESLMLRVDLNGFTQMFMERQEDITDILNDYFAQAREVISRYDGLIYQFVGDEIVFHIKENDGEAARKAGFCVKALFEEARLLEQKYSGSENFIFRLKASWSRGKMRFIKLDQGHALSGWPLIESVRLLNQIENKNDQFLAITAMEYEQIKDVVLVFSRAEVLLKGFHEKTQVVRVKDFISLKETLQEQRWELVPFYRSDSDMIELFRIIKNRSLTHEDVPWKSFLYELSKVYFHRVSPKLREELISFVEFVAKDMENRPIELATIVSAIPAWWGDAEPSAKLCQSLVKFASHRDPRVRANTLLALGHFKTHFEVIEAAVLDSHNRVKADALLALGKIRLSKKVAQQLERMHSRGNEQEKKSADFVMRALLEYYQMADPVFASTNPHLKSWPNILQRSQSLAS